MSNIASSPAKLALPALPVRPAPAGEAKTAVGFVSLGCPKNLVDSEIMLGHLRQAGHELVDPDAARVVVINTCGFIDAAKEESVDAILEQVERKARGEIDRVVVAGCMVQKFGAELRREIPEIDAFVGLDELESAPAAVGGTLVSTPVKPMAARLYDHTAPRILTTPRSHAYLKIAEGCDNPCTFCTIPQMRGEFRSRSRESLVAEARSLEAQGVAELLLIAQDTTRYGEDIGLGRRGLTRLVEDLLAQTKFRWIRFLYAYPKTLDASVLELMAAEERFVSYVDMPLQAVSRRTLAAMRRGGDPAGLRRHFETIRTKVPDISLRTTFIVGFPGETEDDFADTLALVRDVEFDHLGVFTYSPEPGSGAEPLGDPVATEEKERRRSVLLEAQQQISRRRHRAMKRKRFEALVEGPCTETELLLEGRLRSQAPQIDGRLLINEAPEALPALPFFATVEITGAHDYDLVGRIVA